MARILQLQIQHFRSIQALEWCPSPGINCLIGPCDSGKSTVLDAIELCLGARRNVGFGDTDFHALDVTAPLCITVTLGDLPNELLDLDSFGEFLRGFDLATNRVEDEPRTGIETALTMRLCVTGDLEPHWSLYSERAAEQGLERDLPWKLRNPIAPARIGTFSSSNLAWSRNSVLNRLTEERADLGPALAQAARHARTAFGNVANAELSKTLEIVTTAAADLGITVGHSAQALLDAHAVSIGDGAIGLHNESGIPLRALGTGSSRLLVTGLQRQAAGAAGIALIDEVEYGLEPHRLARLLDYLGAREAEPIQQVFMTSHSPVALRELDGNQVHVTRQEGDCHRIRPVGTQDLLQATLRADPEAFLARSVLVCEGASEVGFVRGLDHFWVTSGEKSYFSLGGAYVNAGGGTPDKCLQRATALQALGYRTMAFFDADKPSTAAIEAALTSAGGEILRWRDSRTLEDELFLSLPSVAVDALLQKAIERLSREMVRDHIRSASEGKCSLEEIETESLLDDYSKETRRLLAVASQTKNSAWFKALSVYQEIAEDIVGPNLVSAELGFVALVERLRTWIHVA